MSLLTRYRSGERTAVWSELRALGPLSEEARAEALALSLETMSLVSGNLQLLVPRLEREGWVSLTSLRTAPREENLAVVARIGERTGGPVPPSLLGFWTVVGEINLGWDYYRDGSAPDFGTGLEVDALDPLVVGRPDLSNEDLWSEEGPPYRLDLAPDALHKADVSGGMPYGVALPFAGADPLFAEEPHGLPFVDYLRLALRWGGFPGFEKHAEQPVVQRVVAHLTQGFREF